MPQNDTTSSSVKHVTDMLTNQKDFRIVKAVLAVWILAIHSVILRTIYKHKTLREVQYLLLIALVLFDTLYGVLSVNYVSKRTQTYIFTFTYLSRTSYLNSATVSALLTLNQFIAIRYPLKYIHIVRPKRIVMILIVTIAPLYILVWFIVQTRPELYYFISHILTCVAIMVFVMVYSFRVANNILASLMTNVKYLHGEEAELLHILKRRQRNNREIATLSSVTILFFLPTLAVIINVIRYKPVSLITLKIALIILTLYPAINPLIYIITLSKLGAALKKDWRKLLEFVKIKSMKTGRVRDLNNNN